MMGNLYTIQPPLKGGGVKWSGEGVFLIDYLVFLSDMVWYVFRLLRYSLFGTCVMRGLLYRKWYFFSPFQTQPRACDVSALGEKKKIGRRERERERERER